MKTRIKIEMIYIFCILILYGINAEDEASCRNWQLKLEDPESNRLLTHYMDTRFDSIRNMFVDKSSYDEKDFKANVISYIEYGSTLSEVLLNVYSNFRSVMHMCLSVLFISITKCIIIGLWKFTYKRELKSIIMFLNTPKYRILLTSVPLYAFTIILILNLKTKYFYHVLEGCFHWWDTVDKDHFSKVVEYVTEEVSMTNCVYEKILRKFFQNYETELYNDFATTINLRLKHEQKQCTLEPIQQLNVTNELLSKRNSTLNNVISILVRGTGKEQQQYAQGLLVFEDFLKSFFKNALRVPSHETFEAFRYILVVVFFINIISVIGVVIISLFDIKVKDKIRRILIEVPIYVSLLFSILFYFLFVLTFLSSGNVFISHTMARSNDYALLKETTPIRHMIGKTYYELNFGSILSNSAKGQNSIFSMIDLFDVENFLSPKRILLTSKSEQQIEEPVKKIQDEYLQHLKEKFKPEFNVITSLNKSEIDAQKDKCKSEFDKHFDKYAEDTSKTVKIFENTTLNIEIFEKYSNPYFFASHFEKLAKLYKKDYIDHVASLAGCFVAIACIQFILTVYYMVTIPMAIYDYESSSRSTSKSDEK